MVSVFLFGIAVMTFDRHEAEESVDKTKRRLSLVDALEAFALLGRLEVRDQNNLSSLNIQNKSQPDFEKTLTIEDS